jgi:hypothetical protein
LISSDGDQGPDGKSEPFQIHLHEENSLTLFKKQEGKMRDIINILDEYLKGDAQKRLNLFLSYRSLRSQFVKIEQNERKNMVEQSFNTANEITIKKGRRSQIIQSRFPGISCLKPKSG